MMSKETKGSHFSLSKEQAQNAIQGRTVHVSSRPAGSAKLETVLWLRKLTTLWGAFVGRIADLARLKGF